MPLAGKAAFQGDQRLYKIVARRIAAMIDEHRHDTDWRLPAERDLAELFAVSRPVIREAVIALEVTGVVSVKGRSGIAILPRHEQAEGLGDETQPSHLSPGQVLQARGAIEPGIAEAAAIAQAGSGAKPSALLESMLVSDAAQFAELSAQLFIGTSEATGNPLLVSMMKTMQGGWLKTLTDADLHNTLYSAELRPLWMGHYQTLAAAISMNQPQAAQMAAHRHLSALREEVLALLRRPETSNPGDRPTDQPMVAPNTSA